VKLRAAGPKQRERAREVARAKVADIEARLRDLAAMRDALDALVEACACGSGAVACPILEALEKK
jgi:hypothetical protein